MDVLLCMNIGYYERELVRETCRDYLYYIYKHLILIRDSFKCSVYFLNYMLFFNYLIFFYVFSMFVNYYNFKI